MTEGGAGEGDLTPDRIGPYRLGRVLGVGGMGEVFEAFDTRLHRHVAMKRIRPDRLAAPDGENAARPDDLARLQMKRFRREAKLVARLNHPAIVQVHDLVVSKDGEWLVMERVDGSPLSELLRLYGPVEEMRARHLGCQISAGLAAAHAHGIVHRDLKAANVLVTDEPEQVKILDFGVAKKLWRMETPIDADLPLAHGVEESSLELTQIGGIVGTYRSMSPEQSRGLAIDARSDLFSLGVLLYEMLTGVSPFRADTLEGTLERIRAHRQTPLTEATDGVVSEEFSALVDDLLEKDPAHRPVSAAEVTTRLCGTAGDVQAALDYEAESTITGPTDRTRDDASSSGRNWSGVGRAAGWFAVVLVLLAAIRLLQDQGPEIAAGDGDVGREPWRPTYVAVLPTPNDDTVDEDRAPVLGAVRHSILESVVGLDGLAVLTDDRLLDDRGEVPLRDLAMDLARRLAADEALASRLSCGERVCSLELQRFAAADGRLLWTESFEVLPDDLVLLASIVRARTRRGYPGLAPRGESIQSLSPDRYREYVTLLLAQDKAEVEFEDLLRRLKDLQRTSPDFAPLYLLEADITYPQYFHRRDAELLKRCLDALRTAQRLAPHDPQPVYRLARIALQEGRLNLARDALERLDELSPGDARVGVRRALYLEAQGKQAEARDLMQRSVLAWPSWQSHHEAARLEYRAGHLDGTRRHLQALLQLAPSARSARQFLARIELVEGRLGEAEEQFSRLVAHGAPDLAELSNLGLVRMLLGRYRDAAESFGAALALAPDHPGAGLNLADAWQLLGRDDEANAGYLRVVDLTAEPAGGTANEDEEAEPRDWQSLTVRAQALAHLGRRREAAAEIQRAIQLGGANPQVAYEAALVYSLLGENASALASAEAAIESFGEPWFSLPWFAGLRELPEFQRLLEERSREKPSGDVG